MFSSIDVVFPFIISIGVLFIIWLLIREIVCWYYKINEQIENQRKTNLLLQDILMSLNQKQGVGVSSNEKVLEISNLEISSIELSECDFQYAMNAATDYRENNQNDWRVPTKDELIHIFKNKHNYRQFKDVKYWSSDRTRSGAFVFDFSNGSDDIYRLSNNYYAFFVRGRF
jgi:hypothetical protein